MIRIHLALRPLFPGPSQHVDPQSTTRRLSPPLVIHQVALLQPTLLKWLLFSVKPPPDMGDAAHLTLSRGAILSAHHQQDRLKVAVSIQRHSTLLVAEFPPFCPNSTFFLLVLHPRFPFSIDRVSHEFMHFHRLH